MNYTTAEKHMRKFYDARNEELLQGRQPKAAYLGEKKFKALHIYVDSMRITKFPIGTIQEFEGLRIYLVLENDHLAFI